MLRRRTRSAGSGWAWTRATASRALTSAMAWICMAAAASTFMGRMSAPRAAGLSARRAGLDGSRYGPGVYRIMGVVNVTPDSFSDGGAFLDRDAAVTHGLRLAFEGADLLDVGGESTRPGADPVSEREELDRVIPVIEGIRAEQPARARSRSTRPRRRSPPPRSTPAPTTSTTSPRCAATRRWRRSWPSAASTSA